MKAGFREPLVPAISTKPERGATSKRKQGGIYGYYFLSDI
jgi:hypothetical protein